MQSQNKGPIDRHSIKFVDWSNLAETANSVFFKNTLAPYIVYNKLIFSKFLKYILVQNMINLLVLVFQKYFLTFKSILKNVLTKINLENWVVQMLINQAMQKFKLQD